MTSLRRNTKALLAHTRPKGLQMVSCCSRTYFRADHPMTSSSLSKRLGLCVPHIRRSEALVTFGDLGEEVPLALGKVIEQENSSLTPISFA